MVPKGWNRIALEKIAEVRSGVAKGKKGLKTPIEVPYLRVANVQDGHVDLTEVKTIEIEQDKLERYSLKYGDVLMNEGGDYDKLGRGDVWLGQIKPCLHQNHVFSVRPNQDIVDSFFLAALAASNYGKTYFLSCAKRSTNLASINSTQIKEFPVLVPPLPEQKKIAQILSTWDRTITITEQLLANSQQQKKALMQQLLTGKKRLLDKNGVRFSGEWKWLKAIELFKTVSTKNNSETEELLAVTQDQGVLPRSLLERRVVMPDGSTKGYKLVMPSNFIISLRSFQGGLEYSSYRGLVSPAYTVLAPIKTINDEFFKHYYKSYDFIGHLAVAVIGIRDGKQISYSDFSFLKLPYPSLDEQQKIATVLSTADQEISALQQKLDALKQEKKALMQQLLTGKRRVLVN